MSSVKAVLKTKSNSQNLFPIAIRITKNRKSSYIYIGQYIKKSQWNITKGQVGKSHPDSLNINQLIFKNLSEVNKALLDAETKSISYSSKIIKKVLSNDKTNDFFEIAQVYINNIIDRGKFHQSDIEIKRIDVFKIFLNKEELFFEELNVELLMKFENFLLNKRNLSKRTVVNYMITIRTIFNLAIANSSADIKFYPFGRGKYQIKFPETKKIGLSSEEIIILENIDGLTKAQDYALSAWLLSFYFAGIRITDLLQLKWEDFKDNRLYYRMNKNDKLISLQVPHKVLKILKKLEKNGKAKFLFKELEKIDMNNSRQFRTTIKTTTRNFNRRLEIVAKKAGIEKKMSMHIARHSFGNISGDKIPIQLLQKLYRHSSVTTTIMYQSNFILKDTDEALEKVLNF